MGIYSSKKSIISVFIIWLFLCSFAVAQEKEEITVEWINSDEANTIQSVPHFLWLDNGTAILLDIHKPKKERTFEKLDPERRKLTPILDMEKAVESLKTFLGKEKTPDILPWPISFDKLGQCALYMFGEDIFVLNLSNAQFIRVTETEEEEIGATFAPDGKKIAFVRVNDIYIYDIESKSEKQITHDGSETLLNGRLSFMYWEDIFFRNNGVVLWWLPDSQALAYLQTDVSQVTELQYYDIKPFNPRVIKQRYPLVGETIETVRVGITEINNGKTTWVKGTGMPDEYVLAVDWLPGNKRISFRIMNRNQDKVDLYFADRFSGKSTHILEETDEAWVNVSGDLYFLKDGRHFIWGSERSGYKHLYLYTLDGKLVNQITKGDWAVRGPYQVSYWWGRSVVALDEKKGWVYFTALEKSSIERHLYRIKLDGTKMQRITKEEGFHSVVFSPDAKFYFDIYSNISTLPSLSLYRNDGSLSMVLSEPKSEILSKFDMQYPELFTIPAADGFPMPAQILKPKDFEPKKKHAVIIYNYGGPSAPRVINNWQRFTFFNQILLRKGYLVMTVDNRSATAISKKLENTVLNQMFGENELNDLLAAVKWLKSQPYVDPERVGIWGWSYGGSFTLLAMTQSKEFKAGIAVAPVSDQRFHEPKWAEFAMKRPQDNLEAWEKVSLLRHAKSLHGRLMLVHGTYDDNVRIQNTWSFINELIKAGKNFDLMIYPMRKHGIADRPARVHLFSKMVEFWTKKL